MLPPHIVQSLFETWYNKEYDWYISRKRRGYCLKKNDDLKYVWDHPKQAFHVWKAAFEFMNLKEMGK